jgi:hypothetical protein
MVVEEVKRVSPQHDDHDTPFDDANARDVDDACDVSRWVLRAGCAESGADVDGDGPVVMPAGWSPFPTADEIATINAVRVLDRAQDEGFADEVELLAAVCARSVDSSDLGVLAGIDPSVLPSKDLQLLYAQRVDAVAALVASRQVLATAALAGSESTGDYLDEVHVETEVSLARRISPMAAGLEIETARVLSSTFPGFFEALAKGAVSAAHCRKLVELTRPVTNADALVVIGAKALPKAQRLTVGLFARQVGKLIAEHDPDAAARLLDKVKHDRDVFLRRLPDGLGQVVYTDSWPRAKAVFERIARDGRATRTARRAGAKASAKSRAKASRKVLREGEWAETAAACRADAFAARLLGAEAVDGSVVLDTDPATVECQLVIDLPTLRGEADHVALLDGTPVPGVVGRELARKASHFRRMVTDPVTGHLLDYGRKRYLADDVRDFVLRRDGGCRIPTCGIHTHTRLEADHAEAFPEGETSAANLGALDTTHHQLKTNGYLDIENSAADGSAILSTLWGQRIHIPPPDFLREPDPSDWRPEPPPTPPEDPPPF